MARVIEQVGRCSLEPKLDGTHFDAIARSIIFQQLSGKAAGTIHGRFQGLYGGRTPAPQELMKTMDGKLREIGLSRQKAAYLKDLAQRTFSGEIAVESLHDLDDDAIMDALVRITGVGRWTAQMFLMFRLGRPDVLPDLDLGIQKGIMRAYGLRKLPRPERVKKIGARWAPYRTVASWYMWRLLDTTDSTPRSGSK